MLLTKLEMNGFKSFAKKTEIDFKNGVTAVVGPNGSGKSNIADAVRWVLGEQSARVLRGSKMEDVIFNGTEQRKPQSFCEVSLTFDNTDGKLPIDYSEVSVTRRVYRSGESEYYINRGACRLKDIHELFRDTGIGREGYSIIGQGKVEEILSNKSNDRRAAFEEAAGVMRYRVRKEEAERKLDNTRKNLVRLNDILEELEKQVGPLEEQSATAREYLKLRDELREIEVNVFLYQYEKLNDRITSLDDAMKQMDEVMHSSAATETALSAECSFEEENERALSATISNLQNKLLTLSSGVESSSGEAKVVQERITNLIKERERLQEQITDNTKRYDLLRGEMDSSTSITDENRKHFTQSEAELHEAEIELYDCEQQINALDELLEQQKSSVIEAMNRLSDARSRISRFEAIKDTLHERSGVLDEDETDIKREGEKLSTEYAEVGTHLAAIQAEYAAAMQRRADAINRQNELNAGLIEIQKEVRQMEQSAEAGRSRIKVLDEMKRAHEGYYSSVRNVLRDAERDVELKKRIEGVVGELIRVPKEYETAIEMALGSALQNIVAQNDIDAKYVIEHLRRHEYGRATLLPVSSMRSRLLNEQERGFCRVDGFIGVASDLVSYDARYKGIFENMLGRTVIVRDLDAGIAINRQAHSQFRIATLKGDIINPGGSMTGGSVQKREFSIVGREREIGELTQQIRALSLSLEQKCKQAEKLKAQLDEAGISVNELSEAVHTQDIALATQREKADIVKKYVEQNMAELERVELERSQIKDNLQNIDEQCCEATADQTSIVQSNVITQDDIRHTQELINNKRTEHSGVNEVVTVKKVALMALEKEYTAAQNETRRMEREAELMRLAIERDKKTIDGFSVQFTAMQQQIGSLGSNIDVGRKDIDQLTDQLHTMEEERAKHQLALDDARERREQTNIELNDTRERRHKAELNYSKAQMELAAMQDRIWSDYELTYENALPLRREIAITASHIRAGELKSAIKDLGNVNVSSIEDYKIVKERFESLGMQCDDLTKAESDLQELIGELVATMEQEFKKQFELIQQNFSVVFSELFGGGRAELVLADSNDILNCDIDIIAQPPGKKLQLLSLLSGGERALTAIALLFAILKLKPTAFCILDEIESSLDEANVTNFAGYVKNYSDDTQFILITHRKGSMEVCDSLYGITMEERGVSKVVSAHFNDVA